jgi:hypothetical protein
LRRIHKSLIPIEGGSRYRFRLDFEPSYFNLRLNWVASLFVDTVMVISSDSSMNVVFSVEELSAVDVLFQFLSSYYFIVT